MHEGGWKVTEAGVRKRAGRVGNRERRKRPPKRMAGKMRERTKSPGPAAVWAGRTVTSTWKRERIN